MTQNYNLSYYSPLKVLNPPLHVRDELYQIIKRLKKNKKVKIVDFGSGGGRLTIPLLKNGYEVVAIDIDPNAQKQLLKTTAKIGKSRRLQVFNVFPQGKKFNYILGTDILHHVDTSKYLKIFHQHLSEGGKIIFSEPNAFNVCWLIFNSLFSDWKVEKGIGQINYFNLIKQLKSVGFRKYKITGLFLFPPMLFTQINSIRKLNLFLGDLPILKLFAFRNLIVAQK